MDATFYKSGTFDPYWREVFPYEYIVGWVAGTNGREQRNFVIFNLANITLNGPVTRAVLTIDRGSNENSDQGGEVFALFSIEAPLSAFGAAGVAPVTYADLLWNDLGDGALYGSLFIPSSSFITGPRVSVELNATCIAAINQARQQADKRIGLGGAITSLARGAVHETLFGRNNPFFSPTIGKRMTLTLNGNLPPAISALNATPNPACATEPVTFAVTASDPNFDALTYSWDFGDGSTLFNGSLVFHTFATPGTYTASVTVSDGKGGLATEQVYVVVNDCNHPPLIVCMTAMPNPACAGDYINFIAHATDEDNDALTFTWNFGDGSAEERTTAAGAGELGSAVSHAYETEGTYAVKLKVSDGKAEAIRFLNVVVVKPSLTVEPEDSPVGCPVRFIARTISPNDVRFSGDTGDDAQITVSGNTAVLTTTYSTVGAKTVTASFKECPPVSATAYIYRVVFNTDITVCKGKKKKVAVKLEGAKEVEVTITAKPNPDIPGAAGEIHFVENNAQTLKKTLNPGEAKEIEFIGIKPSLKMHDVLVTSEPHCKFGEDEKARVTVLWVEWHLRPDGAGQEISQDDSARFAYSIHVKTLKIGPLGDGREFEKTGIAFGVELVGMVRPFDFNQRIACKRKVRDFAAWEIKDGKPECIRGISEGTNDSSKASNADEDPQSDESNGKIYDTDVPGFNAGPRLLGALPGTIFALRAKFTETAEFNSEKCSDEFKFFVTRAAQKVQEEGPAGYASINLIPADNTADVDNGLLEFTTPDGKAPAFSIEDFVVDPKNGKPDPGFTVTVSGKVKGGKAPYNLEIRGGKTGAVNPSPLSRQ